MNPNCQAPPHVVVFPFPAQGHVNGAMDISTKLASLGVSITFICTEAYIANMRPDVGHGLPIRLLGLPDGLPQERSMTDSVNQIKVLIEATDNMGPLLEDLLMQLNLENPVVCVLYDFMLWWIGRLGKKLGIPAYIFYAMSANFFSYLSHIPEFVSQGRLPLGPHTDLSDESNMFKIAGFPSMHVSEVPDISWSPNPLCSFDYTLQSTATWRDATGILFNTVNELEEEVIEGLRERAPEMDIRAVGPILPPDFLSGREMDMDEMMHGESADAQRCLKWLDEQPASSVLYVAFGTIACLSEEQLHELAMGLEASKQRFLWVVRDVAAAGAEQVYDGGVMQVEAAELVEAKGKEMNDRIEVQGSTCSSSSSYGGGGGLATRRTTLMLPNGFEERTKGRGVVLRELAPQRKILAHKAVGGFLTHAGWNSTWESICKGVPMLCCPMLGDQGMNGKWVEEVVQIGKVLRKKTAALVHGGGGGDGGGLVDREEVQRQVQVLMMQQQDNPLRLSASRIQNIAFRAALPGGSSHSHLHAFLQTLTSKPPKY